MDLEFVKSTPKCAYTAYRGGDAASSNGGDVIKTSLTRALYLDRKSELAEQTKLLAGGDRMDRATATKLLHMCCNFDSAECAASLLGGELGEVPLVNELNNSGKSPLHTAASAHAARCVELLLQNNARTDLRTRDGQSQLALELSLSDCRMDLNWNTCDCSIEELVNVDEKVLRTVKLLSEKTKEVAAVAYAYAVKGRLASLKVLLIAAAGKVNDCVLQLRDSESGVKERATVYEWLIREAMTLGGGRTTPGLRAAKCASTVQMETENFERRKLLLRGIEVFQLFGAVAQSGGGEKKATSPLIRAAKNGDEAVIQLLLKTNINVNDADAEGNTALHWILKLSRLPCPQQIKILSLLLDHSARVSQKNRLGLTVFHIAAGNGNSEALEVLLLEDPAGVQYKTEMKETPLFFAVKNESKECAELLLTWGANSEILNLRNVNSNTKVKAELPDYKIVSSHGTTIVGIQLEKELIVGVDSFSRSIQKDRNPLSAMPDYEGMSSEVEQKFVQITKGVYAALCGDGNKCNAMVVYLRKVILKFMVKREKPTIESVSTAAMRFFHTVKPRISQEDPASTVFIFFWTEEKKYRVIEVGDEFAVPRVIDEVVFGAGSGSKFAMAELLSPTTLKNVTSVKKGLVIAALEDPSSGAVLRVFSLKDGTSNCEYEELMMDELDDPVFAEQLFQEQSMFVMIKKDHEYVLSRATFLRDLYVSFGFEAEIHWLCVLDDALLVYRVILPSLQTCQKWFNACRPCTEHLRVDYRSGNSMTCINVIRVHHLTSPDQT